MRKERYKNYIAISGGDMSPVTDYVNELEQQISILTDSNVARDLVIEKLKQQKAELINCLAMALDDKRRKLYYSNLKDTLFKYLKEQK
jgi:hypothetical protein